MDSEFWKYLETLIENSRIKIDRPKGSVHPRFPDLIYPLDYGYLKDTTSTDGGGLDVWVGAQTSPRLDGIICRIDLIKKDIEIKLLIGCMDADLKTSIDFHNSDTMRAILIRRQ
jgi:inorganic pyrophosphatase